MPYTVFDPEIGSEHGADNAKVASLILLRAIYLRVGFDDPYGLLPTQNIL